VQHLLGNKKDFSLLEVVTDVLSTDESNAVALEAALGEACNYLVVDHAADAQIAFKRLKDDNKGRAAIIPLDYVDEMKSDVHPDSIIKSVICDSKFNKLKEILLGRVCLVSGIDDGLRKVKSNQVTCVTPEGDIVTEQGVIRSGSKQKNIGIRVGLKGRIETLNASIKKAGAEKEQLEVQMESLIKKRDSLNEETVRENLRQAEQNQRKTEQQLNTIRSQQSMFERSLQEVTEREKQLSISAEVARKELKEMLPEMDHLNTRLEEIIEEQLSLRNDLREKDAQLQRCQLSMNDARVTEQRLQSESQSYEREILQSDSGIKTIKERLDTRAEQAKQSRERIHSLKAETEELEAKVEELRTEKQQADKELNEAEEQASRQRGRIRTIEEQIRQLQRKREVNTELLHQLEIKQSKLEMQSKTLLDYVWETYGKMIEDISEVFDEETDPNTVKSTISNLKERLKSIGEVNHLAIQEYDEEQQRLEFYEKQINDLYEAEEKLRDTIKEINKTANERFNTTFEAIRINFKRVFNMLFQEDDFCDLVLKEKSDDPLDNKVEIIAKPRGKRPSNIEQLSGGEKTLTAIALLFAIYLVKPSPFCILDEVDAPLDDANVDRFTSLLKQFSRETQFIVITHNKNTMDKSEVMYGVTMQETGVSRLVGVRLDEASKVAS
jgi:chromosome segregation protein